LKKGLISGFIDIASIYSAFGVLEEGKKGSFSDWDADCLHKVTSLLLHENIFVLPPVKISTTIPENYRLLLEKFPELASYKKAAEKTDITRISAWFQENINTLQKVWQKNQQNNEFVKWGDFHRKHSFVNHVIRHGSLFEPFFISQLSEVFNCPKSELIEINELSKDLQLVSEWEKADSESDVILLGKKAWLLAGIMRGKIYENVARNENLLILPHPFREMIFSNGKFYKARTIPTTEDLFLKMIIGCSLIETSPQRRIQKWIASTSKARNAILNDGLDLKNADSFDKSVDLAEEAAKKIGLQASSALIRTTIDMIFRIGLDFVSHIYIGPWEGPLYSEAVQASYTIIKGSTIMEDISEPLISTRKRRLQLASKVPGRIQFRFFKPHSRNGF
jgi:hypothetical protein